MKNIFKDIKDFNSSMKILIGIIILGLLVLISIFVFNTIKSNEQKRIEQFKVDLVKYNDELTDYIETKRIETHELYIYDNLNDKDLKSVEGEALKTYIPSIDKKYYDSIGIKNGILVYIGTNKNELLAALDINISIGKFTTPIAGIYSIATETSTFNGNDFSYKNPPIPTGFRALETDSAKWPNHWYSGLVIIDERGNQFVWVPVVDMTNFKLINFGISTHDPDTYIENTTTEEYKAMQTSVQKYGGFYIARYEAAKSPTTGLPISQSGFDVWTKVPWGGTSADVASDTFYGSDSADGAVKYARSMYPNNDSNKTGVISTLVYGTQWDATMNFLSDIKNSAGTQFITNASLGNYSKELLKTGQFGQDNIYDLAGNALEWTMESNTSRERVCRGGRYGSYSTSNASAKYPASARINMEVDTSTNNLGFRCALYVK